MSNLPKRAKHSTTPWKLSNGVVTSTEYAYDGRKVGVGFDIFDGGDAPNEGVEDEWMANAHLIAAAPELLAALKKAAWELNAIRAADGAPQTIRWHNGRFIQTAMADETYWSNLVDECHAALAAAEPQETTDNG